MYVYILRHAEAVEADETINDEWRYLTDKGRKNAAALARKLFSHGLTSCLLVSSPLVRAVQTAQIVAEACGAKCRVEISGLLQPGGDIQKVNEFVRGRKEKHLVLVGHEPMLGQLLAALLCRPGDFRIEKSSCAIVELEQKKLNEAATFVTYRIGGRGQIKSFRKAFGTSAKK